jgi:hypothetical protein
MLDATKAARWFGPESHAGSCAMPERDLNIFVSAVESRGASLASASCKTIYR